jgi:hypothetical protein
MKLVSRSVRGKHDETYRRLSSLALEDDYEGFWQAIHDYERERFKETAKIIAVWVVILTAAWYLGVRYFVK